MSFPGGTSVTRLSVYSGQCADGLAGGTPHLHTASTEAYVVISGSGALQTLDTSGFQETPLRAGAAVWFTPGVIHRAINRGGLEVVVVMSNAGLPEAGDAVMTFPPEILASSSRYDEAAQLPDDEPDEAVTRRRDLAVDGFQRLVAGGSAALSRFYEQAAALVRPRIESWRELYRVTAEADTRRTAEILDALADGDGRHLSDGAVRESPAPPDAGWGMCGRLRAHDVTYTSG
jgi:mannose-6-phosphate isomerase-like protein (cupin superfamily)